MSARNETAGALAAKLKAAKLKAAKLAMANAALKEKLRDAWQSTAEGRRAHAAAYPHRIAIEKAARKYASRDWPEWQALLAARLVCVDDDPRYGRLSDEAALAIVARCVVEGRRAKADAARAA